MSADDPKDRRKLKRAVERIPAAFEAGAIRGTGYIKNVTKEGLFLRTDELPSPQEPVRVVFHNRDGTKIEVSENKIEVEFPDGWKIEIEDGRFEMKDPAGNTVIERPEMEGDRAELLAKLPG